MIVIYTIGSVTSASRFIEMDSLMHHWSHQEQTGR